MERFSEENFNSLKQVWLDMVRIPSPSHHEQKRALFCKKTLEEFGAEGVYIDDAYNVIFPYNCDGSNEITVIAAHIDTVFDESTPLIPVEKDGRIYCPGAGDDTASVAILLFTVKFFIENAIMPPRGILFVCNTCEEGLGNLKGTKALFGEYANRIKEFVSLDCCRIGNCTNSCIGSHRYRVSVKTPGGHSFGDFGNKNAVAEIAKIVNDIYSICVPTDGNTKTTYNVGIISGGTSVNSIAQHAEILCEYRSQSRDFLAVMEEKFASIFKKYESEDVSITVDRVGERPCGSPEDAINNRYLCKAYAEAVKGFINGDISVSVASTDCNVPLSLGIPALAVGVFNGDGEHTTEESVEIASMKTGLYVALKYITEITRK